MSAELAVSFAGSFVKKASLSARTIGALPSNGKSYAGRRRSGESGNSGAWRGATQGGSFWRQGDRSPTQADLVLRNMLAAASREGESGTLLCLSVDRFRATRRCSGAFETSRFLDQLHGCIARAIRHTDAVLPGFAGECNVFLRGCDRAQASLVAERLRALVARQALRHQGQELSVTVSIGIAAPTGDLWLADELLRQGESACRLAEEHGGNCVRCFSEIEDGPGAEDAEMEWVSRILNALRTNRFVLYRQTIRPLSSSVQDAGEHFEVLLRLRLDDGSIASPAAFMPVAERHQLMGHVDRWVISAALSALAGRNPRGRPANDVCGINLSGSSVGDPALLSFILAEFERTMVAPGAVCFEITETEAISNLANAVRLIATLSELGCSFAIDDFGSGTSSFAYLKDLPVHFLKIDGRFVRDMTTDALDREIVGAANRIAHLAGLKTIAEFAHSDDIVEALTLEGVDYIQGNAVQAAMPWWPAIGPAQTR